MSDVEARVRDLIAALCMLAGHGDLADRAKRHPKNDRLATQRLETAARSYELWRNAPSIEEDPNGAEAAVAEFTDEVRERLQAAGEGSGLDLVAFLMAATRLACAVTAQTHEAPALAVMANSRVFAAFEAAGFSTVMAVRSYAPWFVPQPRNWVRELLSQAYWKRLSWPLLLKEWRAWQRFMEQRDRARLVERYEEKLVNLWFRVESTLSSNCPGTVRLYKIAGKKFVRLVACRPGVISTKGRTLDFMVDALLSWDWVLERIRLSSFENSEPWSKKVGLLALYQAVGEKPADGDRELMQVWLNDEWRLRLAAALVAWAGRERFRADLRGLPVSEELNLPVSEELFKLVKLGQFPWQELLEPPSVKEVQLPAQ